MARFEFTMVSDAMMRGLLEASATGAEIIAYLMLVRGLPKDRSVTDCWMPADMAEKKVGMRPDVFSRALRDLCKKTVMATDGEMVPVLTKVSRGCKGHCPHYDDTLGQLISEGRYPAGIARQDGHAISEPIARQDRQAIDDPNARQKQDPLDEFSTLECKAETDQLEGKNDPIGRQSRHPIETRQDIHTVADALLPAAELSIGVSQPHKRETRERSQVATGTEPARANGAAPRGRAIALPSWQEVLAGASTEPEPAPEPAPDRAEYDRVTRMLEEGRYDELTDHDREIYHAGHKAYAALRL